MLFLTSSFVFVSVFYFFLTIDDVSKEIMFAKEG